tara:strand:+ start:4794 stop:6134 length:1341 start_codon:yes stop_codon:yes gene_type:complete
MEKLPLPTSTAFLTDHYELTMLDALIQSGKVDSRSVFEVFVRELPLGVPFGVFAGSGTLAENIDKFSFTEDQLQFLSSKNLVSSGTVEWLSEYRFRGDILTYREGELYFPNSPVMTIEGGLGEVLVLETLILSILNHASSVATAAARIAQAANGKLVMEAGSRRIHPESAVHAARAAYVGGIDATSSLAAGLRWGIPTIGTASHAFTLSYSCESEAFNAQQEFMGSDSIFLVDTYDIVQGIQNAVKATDGKLKGIRLDSGDLETGAVLARDLLDELGAKDAQIMVSGDLDEYRIQELHAAPIDAFESGHRLVTGSGAPSAGFVYKLVEIEDGLKGIGQMRPVAKTSKGKESVGGKKHAKRLLSNEAIAVEEILTSGPTAFDIPLKKNERHLQAPLCIRGDFMDDWELDKARQHLQITLDEIPREIRLRKDGPPAIPTKNLNANEDT